MSGNGTEEPRKSYVGPQTIFIGRIESITGGLICSATAYKNHNDSEDDVTPYGFLGVPFCFELND